MVANVTPLRWDDVEVIKVEAGGKFNRPTWAGGGRRYLLDVVNYELLYNTPEAVNLPPGAKQAKYPLLRLP